MEQRHLGSNGPLVSAIGLGCMGMSDFCGPADDKESLATIDAALEAGVTLFDTGDFYGMGHNELLLREALKSGKRDRVFIQVKFGAQRGPEGAFLGLRCAAGGGEDRARLYAERLNTDYIDLYMPARLDPAVPIEETVGAIAELVKAGYVRHIGLSEMGGATIRRAHKVHPIAGLQIEYGLMTRGIETEILPTLRELGIAVTAYGVLGRGLLGGLKASDFAKPGDFRSHTPRFQGENLASNLDPRPAAGDHRRGEGRHRGAARDRLGAVAGRGHHPAGRHQEPQAPGRGGLKAAAIRLSAGRPRADRGRRSGRCRRRHHAMTRDKWQMLDSERLLRLI